MYLDSHLSLGSIKVNSVQDTSLGKSRRWNIALDARLYFVSAGAESITMKHIAVTLGYDRF